MVRITDVWCDIITGAAGISRRYTVVWWKVYVSDAGQNVRLVYVGVNWAGDCYFDAAFDAIVFVCIAVVHWPILMV